MNDLDVRVVQTPGKIEANFAEIEEALKNQMQAYASLEVTEENIPERKADVATLRKIQKAVDDERKKVKASYDAPLKEFEAQVKNLTGIIDKEISRILKELDVFEQKRREEKRKHIEDLYNENIGEYAEFLPLAMIKSERWENKTCKDNDIVYDIQERIVRVRGDLETIKAIGSEFEDKLIDYYKAAGNDITAVIKRENDLKEAKRAAEARVEAEKKAEANFKAPERSQEPENSNGGAIPHPVENKAENGSQGRALRVPLEYWDQAVRLLQFNEIPFEEV
jgi:hypothetical protein